MIQECDWCSCSSARNSADGVRPRLSWPWANSPHAIRRWRILRGQHGSPCAKQPDRGYQSSEDRLCGGLQGRPPESLSAGFLEADLFVRRVPGVVCFSDTAVQYDHINGTADAQHPAFVCPIRTRDHRRTHPRQEALNGSSGQVHRWPAQTRIRYRRSSIRGQ